MDCKMNICQVNANKSYVVMSELGVYMCEKRVSVALVQEPYVLHGSVRGLPTGFRVVTSGALGDGTGVSAVVINDANVDILVIDKYTNVYGVCVLIKGALGSMYVVSVYCRFGEPIEPYLQYMEEVREMCGGVCMLLGMDANAVSPLWFSKGLNQGRGRISELNGRLIEEWLLERRMNVLNEPSEWFTFSGVRGESDIDVTITNEAGSMYEYQWSVQSGWGMSDHNLILIVVSTGQPSATPTASPIRWQTAGVQWKDYQEDIRLLAEGYGYERFSRESVDEKVRLLTEWMTEVNDWNLRRIPNADVRRTKWWSHELDCKKHELRRLRRAFQRGCRSPVSASLRVLRSNFKKCEREYKAMISRAKMNNWHEYVSVSGNENPWGHVYKMCRGKKGGAEICSIKVDGEYTTTWEGSVNALMNVFFPSAIVEDASVRENLREIDRSPPPEFSSSEIEGSIQRCKVRKAPGLDGINGGMIRAVWGAIPEYVSCMFAQCLSENYFPVAWKMAILVVLLKSPDKVRSDPGSYRPVCLLNTWGKVLEGMMVSRLEQKLLNVEISASQFGFTRGKSTVDAWKRVQEGVSRSGKKYVLGIYVDFKGAFDNLSWHAIIAKLAEVECDELKLWISYFECRKVCMVGKNERVWKTVNRGCPQGSKSGPAIWNLMINDLLLALEREGCGVVAFADDLTILVEGDSRAELERAGTVYVRHCSEWGERVGVSVSVRKTECILLKGSLSLNRPPHIRLNDSAIKYVTRVKHLGIWVGERMNFRPHLEYLRVKMLGIVGALRRVMRKDWGLRRRAISIIYKGLFVACMSYGAGVWFRTLSFAYARESLNRCQRLVLYACLNVCRTVSTDAMQVLHGELPWDLEATRKGLLFIFHRGIASVEGDLVMSDEVNGLNRTERETFVKERMMDVWQRRWNESTKGRLTYEFIPNVRFSSEHERFAPGLCLGYLLTGHGRLNVFLYEKGLCNTTACLCGNARESVKHILGDCPLYDDLRDLTACGLHIEAGILSVGGALSTNETYDRLNEFALAMFARRTNLMNGDI